MTVVSGQTKRFTAASPVTRYWLANCVGFSLAGGGRGTVERVIADSDPYVPVRLEIRTGRNRVRRVPAAAVVEIVPAERVIVLGRPHAERTQATRDHALRLARSALAVTGVVLVEIGTTTARLCCEAWRVGAPAAVAGSRWAGRESVRLVRSVPWQQYGRSVRSVTTRLWQGVSTRSSRLRTTSSARISAWRSARRARSTSST